MTQSELIQVSSYKVLPGEERFAEDCHQMVNHYTKNFSCYIIKKVSSEIETVIELYMCKHSNSTIPNTNSIWLLKESVKFL
jgi:hypothetical protein